MQDKIIVVTGASAGIGGELAKIISNRGAIPVLVARRENELLAVAAKCHPNSLAIVADMTERTEVQRVFNQPSLASATSTRGSTMSAAASPVRCSS